MIRVNGTASQVVPATDRGLAYGDGVFRTVALCGGRIRHWAAQYAKLAADCGALRLPCPARDFLEDEVAALALDDGRHAVRITVTRGDGPRGYRPSPAPQSTTIVAASAWPAYPAAHERDGVAVFPCALRLAHQPALAGVKHLNRLENVLARAEWTDEAYAEGLLRDSGGLLVGGTMSNVFIVEEGRLLTPSLTRCGIAGVSRELVLAQAGRHGVPCAEADIAWDRALCADEVFVVNSLIGAWRVRAIGDEPLGDAGFAGRARGWLQEVET